MWTNNECWTVVISVAEWEGETLEMARISRLDMGAYLCIASNGIPPTVSKQIKVSVDCKYILCLSRCDDLSKIDAPFLHYPEQNRDYITVINNIIVI